MSKSEALPLRKAAILATKLLMGVLLLSLGWGYMTRSERENPKFAVDTFFKCLQTSDSACLRDLMSPSESRHLSGEQWEQFVDSIWRPVMTEFRGKEGVKYEEGLDPSVMVFGTKEFQGPNGSRMFVGAPGERTEADAVIYPVFATMLVGLFQTYRVNETETRSACAKRALQKLKPRLEALGINGAMIPKLDSEFVTWDAWLKRLERSSLGPTVGGKP